jgi:hypothetical protein
VGEESIVERVTAAAEEAKADRRVGERRALSAFGNCQRQEVGG